MALASFFERVYGAVGGHLSVSRESLSISLEKTIPGIHCGIEYKQNDLWIAELSTNLLARLYPQLALSGPKPIVSKLKDLASSINPEIEFAEESQATTSICVGSAFLHNAIFPSARGWVAYLRHQNFQTSGVNNPYTAGAAASLACAELFRRVFLKVGTERDIELSLLDYGGTKGNDLPLTPRGLGDVVFAGVGAVGNAAIWAFARDKNLRGNLLLVDAEELTLSNLQRYVLGLSADISRPKVQIAKDLLRGTQLNIEAIQETLEDFAESRKNAELKTICVSVDNIETRRVAQALLPKLVVNGWTGDRALGASWHVFSHKAACLACLYQPHGQGPSATEQAARALGLSVERATMLWVTRQPMTNEDLELSARHLGVKQETLEPWRAKGIGELYTDIVCGAVPLDVTGVGRVETVPLAHQSALAGILMAAELVKRTDKKLGRLSQKEPLISWDDVLRPPPAIWSKPRPRETGCICGDPDYQQVFLRRWKSNN